MGGRAGGRLSAPGEREGNACLLGNGWMDGWTGEVEKWADSTREASKHTIKFAHYTTLMTDDDEYSRERETRKDGEKMA